MRHTCSKTMAKFASPAAADPLPVWKRTIDVAFVFAALPFLVLCTFFMAIMIKTASPGPILFRQERIGYRSRRFECLKFRTMHVGADANVHKAHCEELIRSNTPMVKMDSRHDSRLIPGGWLLRASGLDELPQLIEVLRGNMSLIGPRPCTVYEYEQYLPWQRERFDTLPGLTGLWQVSGKNHTTFDEMIRLDIHYAHHKSIWMDLKIILLTVPALLRQIGDALQARKPPAPTPVVSCKAPDYQPAQVNRGKNGGGLAGIRRAT